MLQSEINALRKENYDLRGEASGGPSTSSGSYESHNNSNSQKIAKELRAAADSAEFSLRYILKFCMLRAFLF